MANDKNILHVTRTSVTTLFLLFGILFLFHSLVAFIVTNALLFFLNICMFIVPFQAIKKGIQVQSVFDSLESHTACFFVFEIIFSLIAFFYGLSFHVELVLTAILYGILSFCGIIAFASLREKYEESKALEQEPIYITEIKQTVSIFQVKDSGSFHFGTFYSSGKKRK